MKLDLTKEKNKTRVQQCQALVRKLLRFWGYLEASPDHLTIILPTPYHYQTLT